jgi:hypothetical protein
MISDFLVKSMGGDQEARNKVMQHALVHDIEEIWTGDVPSPVKDRLRANGSLSSESPEGVGIYVPISSPVYEGEPPVYTDAIGILVSTIVRAADLIETYWWISQYAIGKGARSIISDCQNRLTRFQLEQRPELQRAMNNALSELFE